MINVTLVRLFMMATAGVWATGDVPAGAMVASVQETPAPQTGQTGQTETVSQKTDRDRKVSALAALIAAALKKGTSQPAQLEAQLSLLISQSQSGCGDSKAALTQAAAEVGPLAGPVAVALKNISGAVERCESEGTAALANAQTIVQQGTTLGFSGGSSNYIPPQTASVSGGLQ